MSAPKMSKKRRGSSLKKIRPTCSLPHGGLRGFSAEDVQRLRRRLSDVLECVVDRSFSLSDAEKRYGSMPEKVAREVTHTQSGRRKALTLAEERDLFLRFNYARLRMMRILEEHAGKRLTVQAARDLLHWDAMAAALCEEIIQANLGLVPTMVERSRVVGVDFSELISEGHLALLRSVDKFDCARGFKFSTYACRAILTSIARSVALMARYRNRFPMEYDPDLQRGDMVELRRADADEDFVTTLRSVLRSNRADLTRTEKRVISERFGVQGRSTAKPLPQKTLRQVAEIFGVTKERVRQIQNKALVKLRTALEESGATAN